MATARTRTTGSTRTKKKAPTTPKPKTLKIEKKDIVIEPVQYVVMDGYVLAPEKKPAGLKLASNGYDDEGSNKKYQIENARVYRIEDNLAMIQFPCGDYVYVRINEIVELFQAVRDLDVTKQIRSVNES